MQVVVSEINLGPMFAKLKRALPAAMEVLPEMTQELARLMISSGGNIPGMVQVLPPASKGKTGGAAGKQGMAKVAADIGRVYWTPARAYDEIEQQSGKGAADAFYAAIKGRTVTVKGGRTRRLKGTPAEAERILRANLDKAKLTTVGRFDGGTAHEGLRMKDGTIGKRVLPRQVVLDPRALAAYVKLKQSHVGTLAASFNAAATALSAKGMPAYVTRHGSQFSAFAVEVTRTAFWIRMTAFPGFGGSEINRRWHNLIGYRLRALDTRGYLTRIRKVFLEPRTDSLRLPAAA